MASNNEGYWSRSWAMLTRDEGWIKPVLVLAAANLVPIVGPFGVDGYALEWARLTAWGVDAAPKQSKVNISACIASGARAFVVMLGYGFALGLLRMLVATVLGEVLGGILSAALAVVMGIVIIAAKLRATIYQSIGAGYQVERMYDMIKRDYKGLLRIAGLSAVLGIAVGVVASVLISGTLLARMGGVIGELIEYERYGYVDDYQMASLVLKGLGNAIPFLFVAAYLVGVGSVIVQLVLTTSVGLWMRQFDVRNWGESSDPLPTDAPAGGYDVRGYDNAGYTGTTYAPTADAPMATSAPQPTPEAAPAPAPAPTSAPMPVPTPVPIPMPTPESARSTEPEPEAPFTLDSMTYEPTVAAEPVDAQTEVLSTPDAPEETLLSEAAAFAASQVQEEPVGPMELPVELFSLQDAASEVAGSTTFDSLVDTLVENAADYEEQLFDAFADEGDEDEGEGESEGDRRVISAIPLTPPPSDEEAPEEE